MKDHFKEGDRVYTYDFIDGSIKNYYGTIHKNEHAHVSDWYIRYDDGQELAVLDIRHVYSATLKTATI